MCADLFRRTRYDLSAFTTPSKMQQRWFLLNNSPVYRQVCLWVPLPPAPFRCGHMCTRKVISCTRNAISCLDSLLFHLCMDSCMCTCTRAGRPAGVLAVPGLLVSGGPSCSRVTGVPRLHHPQLCRVHHPHVPQLPRTVLALPLGWPAHQALPPAVDYRHHVFLGRLCHGKVRCQHANSCVERYGEGITAADCEC